MNPVARLRQSTRPPFLQVIKTAVAVIAAVLICKVVINGPFPIFSAIAALLVLQPSINQSFVRGLERSAGVVLGVLLATGVHALLGKGTAVVLLVVVIALIIGWALRLTPTSATQISISGILVMTMGLVTPNYAVDRIIETLIGALVALIVNALIVPPVLVDPAHLALARLGRDTAAAFERLAIGLTEGWTRPRWDAALVTARKLRQQESRTDAAITLARESLTMNPRGGRNRALLLQDADTARHMSVLVTRAIGMTRATRDNFTPELASDHTIERIATELARIAAEVRHLSHRLTRTASTTRWSFSDGLMGRKRQDIADDEPDEQPTLTAPVTVMRPNDEHWVLIGSLLEDIRRIREELLGEDG